MRPCRCKPVRVQPCLAFVWTAEEDLADTSPCLCQCQHLHGYSSGMAPEDVFTPPCKDKQGWILLAERIGSPVSMPPLYPPPRLEKPPRQATQWGEGGVEGVGNKLWLLQWIKRQWMIEWLNKLNVKRALCHYSVRNVCMIHSSLWNNDL